MINSSKLKEKMVERKITQKILSESLKIAQPTLNQKINNVRPMLLEEVDAIAEILNIPLKDYNDYFFYNHSSATQLNEDN